MQQTQTIERVKFHACPRCHGDLFLDEEEEQYFCLQCARYLPITAILGQPGAWPLPMTRQAA